MCEKLITNCDNCLCPQKVSEEQDGTHFWLVAVFLFNANMSITGLDLKYIVVITCIPTSLIYFIASVGLLRSLASLVGRVGVQFTANT
jgi:hypothetical protein